MNTQKSREPVAGAFTPGRFEALRRKQTEKTLEVVKKCKKWN
jgi:hypothetical protein